MEIVDSVVVILIGLHEGGLIIFWSEFFGQLCRRNGLVVDWVEDRQFRLMGVNHDLLPVLVHLDSHVNMAGPLAQTFRKEVLMMLWWNLLVLHDLLTIVVMKFPLYRATELASESISPRVSLR
jgi:hypothetical protein